jgi:hypothetical protein
MLKISNETSINNQFPTIQIAIVITLLLILSVVKRSPIFADKV